MLGGIPNGIVLSPDEHWLYLTALQKIMRYEVRPDGTLGAGTSVHGRSPVSGGRYEGRRRRATCTRRAVRVPASCGITAPTGTLLGYLQSADRGRRAEEADLRDERRVRRQRRERPLHHGVRRRVSNSNEAERRHAGPAAVAVSVNRSCRNSTPTACEEPAPSSTATRTTLLTLLRIRFTCRNEKGETLKLAHLAFALAIAFVATACRTDSAETPGFTSNGRGAPVEPKEPPDPLTHVASLGDELGNYPVVGPFRLKSLRAAPRARSSRSAPRVQWGRRRPVSSRCPSTYLRRRTSTWTAHCGMTNVTSGATVGLALEQQQRREPLQRHTAIGDYLPRTAAWGYCDRDYPRAAIVSPYRVPVRRRRTTSALLAEAVGHAAARRSIRTRRCPASGRAVTRASTSRWRSAPGTALLMNQIPTYPLAADARVSNCVWCSSYFHEAATRTPSHGGCKQNCWPEGFMRRYLLRGHAS